MRGCVKWNMHADGAVQSELLSFSLAALSLLSQLLVGLWT